MGWGLVIQGIGAAAGLFNAIDEAHANRRIAGDLDDIKQYLKEIKLTLKQIKIQNLQILEKLDKLPEQIRQIVAEEVAISLLTEKYSDMDNIRETFLIIRRGRTYNLRSDEWLIYSGAMNYVFDHENRISYLFDLINVCEIALIISRGRSKPLVLFRLDEKIELVTELYDALLDNIEAKLDRLLIDLDNSKFIESHNLSIDLDDFNKLTFEKKPNRKRTRHYTERVCERQCIGRLCDGERIVCHDEPRSERVWDTAFHKARDRHVASLQEQISDITENIFTLAQLKEIINTLARYRRRITSVPLEEINTQSFVMYFEVDESDTTADKTDRPRLDENDMKQFDEYFS